MKTKIQMLLAVCAAVAALALAGCASSECCKDEGKEHSAACKACCKEDCGKCCKDAAGCEKCCKK